MSAGKVIESVIIFGGIGAMAYLLLKKPIPKKQDCEYDLNEMNSKLKDIQYAQLTNRTSNAPAQIKKLRDEYNVLKAKYDRSQCGKLTNVKPMFSEDYGAGLTIDDYKPQKDFDRDSAFRDSELNQPLIDPMILNSGERWYRYDATYQRLYAISGQIKANTCNELDALLASLDTEIAQSYKMLGIGLKNYQPIIDTLKQAKADAEAKFNKFNCRDKIEAERTKSLIDLQSQGSIKAEESIVNKGFIEQKTYIILGALVLLTGFYVVVKK